MYIYYYVFRSSSSISPVRQAKPSHIVKVPINTRPIKRPPSKLSEGHLSATTDLLGSILDGQSLLTTNSRDIQISKEGLYGLLYVTLDCSLH